MAIPPMVLGQPRLPEIGHLKLGGKGESRTSARGTTYNVPVKFDSWVITTRRRDGVNLEVDEDLMEALRSYKGNDPEAPLRIPIFLAYNEPELNFYTQLAIYAGRKRQCWNDTGTDKATRIFDENKKPCAPRQVACPCPLLEFKDGRAAPCKWHGTLRVILRLPGASMGGFFTFRTTSKNSIKNIEGGMARFAHETGGVLAGLPLELVCAKQTVQTPDEKTTDAMIVHIDYPGDPEQFLMETVEVRKRWIERRQVLGQIGVQERRLLLEFQGHDEEDNAEDINKEFQPETVGASAKEATSREPAPPEPGEVKESKVTPPRRGRRSPEPPPKDAEFTLPDEAPPPVPSTATAGAPQAGPTQPMEVSGPASSGVSRPAVPQDRTTGAEKPAKAAAKKAPPPPKDPEPAEPADPFGSMFGG